MYCSEKDILAIQTQLSAYKIVTSQKISKLTDIKYKSFEFPFPSNLCFLNSSNGPRWNNVIHQGETF